MAEWDPDVIIDEALVRALLAEQFPQLDAHTMRLVGEGFDNSVWVIDEEWAFRFPRRAIAVGLVARELAVLPRLRHSFQFPFRSRRSSVRRASSFRDRSSATGS